MIKLSYKNNNGELAKFVYYFSFSPYFAGERFVKFLLTITSEDTTISSYTEYPTLAKKLEELVVSGNGVILPDAPAQFGFIFNNKEELYKFINYVSDYMDESGIYFMGVDWCSAFPSATYATKQLEFTLGNDCTICELEDTIRKACRVKELESVCTFMDLPLNSAQEFCWANNADLSEFMKEWNNHIQSVLNSNCTERVKSIVANISTTARSSLNTTEEVSKEYKNFQSMWY